MSTTIEEVVEHLTFICARRIQLGNAHRCEVEDAENLSAYLNSRSHNAWDTAEGADKDTPHLILTVKTGGYAGGNYMGGRAEHFQQDGADDVTLEALDIFCEECVPNLTFREYRRLNTMVETGEYSISEHYGNEISYKVITLSLTALTDMLNELGHDVVAPETTDQRNDY